jgi:hypothetical protein
MGAIQLPASLGVNLMLQREAGQTQGQPGVPEQEAETTDMRLHHQDSAHLPPQCPKWPVCMEMPCEEQKGSESNIPMGSDGN